jgi:site-specific DNA recombinase
MTRAVPYPKSPDTGLHVSRINPAEEHIRSEVPELRIIDQETWNAVKARQLAMRHDPKTKGKFWTQQRPRYLFSFLLKCGCCGSGMSKISKTHYGCSAARNKGEAVCDNRRGISQQLLETKILSLLEKDLMDPTLLDVFCKEYTAHINRLRQGHNSSVVGYRAELAKLQGRQKRIIKAVMDGYNTPGMKAESNAINAREQELMKLLTEQKGVSPILLPNMAKRYRMEVNRLIGAMRDEQDGGPGRTRTCNQTVMSGRRCCPQSRLDRL